MTIAEMRMLGRKINAERMAQAQVEVAPVSVVSNVVVAPVVEVVQVVEPVVESVRESASYVIIDEVPAAPVVEVVDEPKKEKKARRSVGSILGKLISKKKEDDVIDTIEEIEAAVADTQEIETPNLTREELIKSIEEALDKVPDAVKPRAMTCNGCKDLFYVLPEDQMFKTGRCPKCTEAIEPVKTESAYGMTTTAVVTEKATKKKGLRAGGKKTSAAGIGIDLAEIM